MGTGTYYIPYADTTSTATSTTTAFSDISNTSTGTWFNADYIVVATTNSDTGWVSTPVEYRAPSPPPLLEEIRDRSPKFARIGLRALDDKGVNGENSIKTNHCRSIYQSYRWGSELGVRLHKNKKFGTVGVRRL